MNELDREFCTYPRWDDLRYSSKEVTEFGEQEAGLIYDYSDRLWDYDYEKAERCTLETNTSGIKRNTARWYQAYLSAYCEKPVVVKHIAVGIKRSNGYPYCVFGYVFWSVGK